MIDEFKKKYKATQYEIRNENQWEFVNKKKTTRNYQNGTIIKIRSKNSIIL